MLSIIIPTYNEENYIEFLLRSIEAQSYKDYEVIVADAQSKDRTREIAAQHGARVVDGGMPATGRNRGADVAKGEILLFLDADVVLPDPWFLQGTVAEFEKRKLGVATCEADPMSDKKIDKVFHEVFNYFMRVTAATLPHAPGFCIFARKSVHDKLRGFNEEIKLAEDHDYAHRAAKIAKFGVLKTYRIPVSVRRMDRDGRANIMVKFLLCELYMQVRGAPKTDLFKYSFGHTGTKKKSKSADKHPAAGA